MGENRSVKEKCLEKPPVRVTPKGTQFVRVIDIITSEAGKRELKRVNDAHLVKPAGQRRND